MDDVQVVAQMTGEKNGYTAVQLGAGSAKAKNVSKAMRGHFAKASVMPKAKLAEFRVSEDALVEVGANTFHLILFLVRKLMWLAHRRVRVLLVR